MMSMAPNTLSGLLGKDGMHGTTPAASPATRDEDLDEEGYMRLRGLRQARQRSGLSISQLAELTGLRRETIAHLEHGKEEPQPYALHRLAATLGASTSELLGLPALKTSA